jgi:glycosyltransferase involved in cell wall biosynthesis
MKKILIVLGSYFPKPSANGICVQQVANKLIEKGVEVSIVANKQSGMEDFEVINGVKVYRVELGWIERIIELSNKNNFLFSNHIIKIMVLIRKIKLFLSFPIWPLISPLRSFKIYSKLKQLHQVDNFDVVMPVYTPIEGLIAGILLKMKFGNFKLIYYFLDTLSGGTPPGPFSKKWLSKRGFKWENLIFKKADSIFILESHKNNYLDEKYKRHHAKIEVVDIPLVRNIKSEIKNSYNYNSNKITFVFTGSLQKKVRNPSFFIELFKRLNVGNLYELNIFGSTDSNIILNNTYAKEYGIRYHGLVDINKAYEEMLNADTLVNIGNDSEHMIPSKIFEYLSLGKPVIATYKSSVDPSIPYLKKYPLSLLLEEDWDKMDQYVNELENFINNSHNKTLEFEKIKEIYFENTPSHIVKKILGSS